MSDTPPVPPTDREQALLQRLRELARRRDAVPERVTAAARSALPARGRADTEAAGGG
jgi:chorismate mutase